MDLWGSFVGRADMYMKDGLHLSGKGAAVFADKLSAAVDSDLGTMTIEQDCRTYWRCWRC